SYGPLASTTPSPRRNIASVSPQVVASSREPLLAKMFSRALGSSPPTSAIVCPSASNPRANISAARIALSQVDSAAALVGSPPRATPPLCNSSHRPSVNGAVALASIGIPTVADRTAATTQLLRSAGAMESKETSPHNGAALRHRRGVAPSKKPTPQPSAFIRPCFCRRGAYDCTHKPYGGVNTSE